MQLVVKSNIPYKKNRVYFMIVKPRGKFIIEFILRTLRSREGRHHLTFSYPLVLLMARESRVLSGFGSG